MMNSVLFNKIHQINYLTSELDAIYHQASVKIGLADSVMQVLYALHDNGEKCLLSEIYKQSGISKQTVNSAIRRLEEDEIVYLENHKGKAKMVYLTKKGERYVSDTVVRLCNAEIRAFESWSDKEVDDYVMLMEKYVDSFRGQMQNI